MKFSSLSSDDPTNLTFSDLQKLNQYTELLARISHSLLLNIEVIDNLRTDTSYSGPKEPESSLLLSSSGDEAFSSEATHFRAVLDICKAEHQFLRHHVAFVKENADRLAAQVRSSQCVSGIRGRDLLIRVSYGQLRDTIALQDSNTMLTLTQKTIQEAQTVKTITFVALVYLPATFTAVSPFLNSLPRFPIIILSSSHSQN